MYRVRRGAHLFRVHLKIAHDILLDVVLNRGTLVGESTICKSRSKGRCVLLRCPAGHQTVAPPVDPFGVRNMPKTLPLGLSWPRDFGSSLLGLTTVSWCRTRPLFLGARASLSGAVVPDVGTDVGVLHYTRLSDSVSPACRTLM